MDRSFVTVNGLPAKLVTLGEGIEADTKDFKEEVASQIADNQ